MALFKKIAFVFVYYFLASIIDQLFMMFFGNVYISFILTALCICLVSVGLRNAQILKRNYNQEQRDAYSKSFKTKFKHIVCSVDFLVETVIGVVVCLVFMIAPRVAMGSCLAFTLILFNRAYALVLMPMFLVANFVVWYLAYHKSFKKKKY